MLVLSEVVVRYGSTRAVDRVDLTLEAGECLALVGPSGCGKSSLLRAVAGLEPLAGGTVMLDGRRIDSVPTDQRPIGLMFQDHALFEHRDVAGNVAFGLRMQRWEAARQRQRVAELLELVGLAGYGSRAIATLSGGEAQRVALARTLAPGPRVVLLDEPLGSLDRSLRERLIDELPEVLAATRTAAIHVTHDQDEAFALGDRIGVMVDGRLLQVGPPAEVWARPVSLEVADVLGHRNVVKVDGRPEVWRSDAATFTVATDDAAVGQAGADRWVTVERVVFRGVAAEVWVRTDEGQQLRFLLRQEPPTVGDRVGLVIDPERIIRL
jgi:thiamine transport system ATP-binding protein